jgi:hypothetical protein
MRAHLVLARMHIRERMRKHSENVTDRFRKCETRIRLFALLWLTASTLTLPVTKDGYVASAYSFYNKTGTLSSRRIRCAISALRILRAHTITVLLLRSYSDILEVLDT